MVTRPRFILNMATSRLKSQPHGAFFFLGFFFGVRINQPDFGEMEQLEADEGDI